MVEELYELAERVDRNYEAAKKLEGEQNTTASLETFFATDDLVREASENYELDAERFVDDHASEKPEAVTSSVVAIGIEAKLEDHFDSAAEFVDEYVEVNA